MKSAAFFLGQISKSYFVLPSQFSIEFPLLDLNRLQFLRLISQFFSDALYSVILLLQTKIKKKLPTNAKSSFLSSTFILNFSKKHSQKKFNFKFFCFSFASSLGKRPTCSAAKKSKLLF